MSLYLAELDETCQTTGVNHGFPQIRIDISCKSNLHIPSLDKQNFITSHRIYIRTVAKTQGENILKYKKAKMWLSNKSLTYESTLNIQIH